MEEKEDEYEAYLRECMRANDEKIKSFEVEIAHACSRNNALDAALARYQQVKKGKPW